MKTLNKNALAIAVASAVCASGAVAQNVSMYGRLDTGLQAYDYQGSSSTSATRAANSLVTSSRFGFQGSEDLGGGLKAEFQLESGLTLSNGIGGKNSVAASSSSSASGFARTAATGTTIATMYYTYSYSDSTSTDTFMFDRAAWVGLSGAFGSVKLGRTQHNHTDVDSGVSQSGNTTLVGRFGTTNLDALGDKAGNSITYTSPVINGVQVQVGRQLTSTNANNTTTADDNSTLSSYALSYTTGALKVLAGSADKEGDYEKQTSIGASYDFGMVRVGFVQSSYEKDASTTYKASVLSAAVPMGNGLTLSGGYHAAKKDNDGTSNGKGLSLLLQKDLSKRTQVYASYLKVTNEATGQYSFSGLNSAATSDLDQKALSVGIVHIF